METNLFLFITGAREPRAKAPAWWSVKAAAMPEVNRKAIRPLCGSQRGAPGERGFSLVELMVITSIIAILAAVAVPAYINYINRARQAEPVSNLMVAKMEQEEFWANNVPHHYAGTIGCLASFADTACLANCANCARTSVLAKEGYLFAVDAASTNGFTVSARKKLYSYAPTDVLTINANTNTPKVQNPDAIAFSIFQWLFD